VRRTKLTVEAGATGEMGDDVAEGDEVAGSG
jgi:hypothetical protein